MRERARVCRHRRGRRRRRAADRHRMREHGTSPASRGRRRHTFQTLATPRIKTQPPIPPTDALTVLYRYRLLCLARLQPRNPQIQLSREGWLCGCWFEREKQWPPRVQCRPSWRPRLASRSRDLGSSCLATRSQVGTKEEEGRGGGALRGRAHQAACVCAAAENTRTHTPRPPSPPTLPVPPKSMFQPEKRAWKNTYTCSAALGVSGGQTGRDPRLGSSCPPQYNRHAHARCASTPQNNPHTHATPCAPSNSQHDR